MALGMLVVNHGRGSVARPRRGTRLSRTQCWAPRPHGFKGTLAFGAIGARCSTKGSMGSRTVPAVDSVMGGPGPRRILGVLRHRLRAYASDGVDHRCGYMLARIVVLRVGSWCRATCEFEDVGLRVIACLGEVVLALEREPEFRRGGACVFKA